MSDVHGQLQVDERLPGTGIWPLRRSSGGVDGLIQASLVLEADGVARLRFPDPEHDALALRWLVDADLTAEGCLALLRDEDVRRLLETVAAGAVVRRDASGPFLEVCGEEAWEADNALQVWVDLFCQESGQRVVRALDYVSNRGRRSLFDVWPGDEPLDAAAARWEAKAEGERFEVLGDLREAILALLFSQVLDRRNGEASLGPEHEKELTSWRRR